MGFWQGIERGIGAIRQREADEADRALRREMFDEQTRQWEADHKIKVLSALQSSGAARTRSTRGGKGPSTETTDVTQEYVLKRGIELGVGEKELAERIATYGPAAVNKGLDLQFDYNEAYKDHPDQIDAETFFRNITFAEIASGGMTNYKQQLENWGYDSDYLDEFGIKDVEFGPTYAPIETPFESPMTPKRMKEIGDAQITAASSALNRLVVDLKQRANAEGLSAPEKEVLLGKAGDLELALAAGDGTSIPMALSALSEEEKAQVWSLITEVDSGFIAPALRGFEPPKPEPRPQMSSPEEMVPLPEAMTSSSSPESFVELPEAPVKEHDTGQTTGTPLTADGELTPPAVGKIGDTMYFQDMKAYYDWLVNNPVNDLKVGDVVMVGTQAFTIDEEFTRHFP